MDDTGGITVVLTTGRSDGGRRAAIAFGVALASLATGNEVHVFLALEAAVFGTPAGSEDLHPPGFSDPLATYIRHFVELGGTLEVCSSCYTEYCRGLPLDERGAPALHRNATLRGLGVLAERAHQMPVLTF
jgi:predicted peroxiredoxin